MIRIAIADVSLCIDMEAWQQQFSRKVVWARILKNKVFFHALKDTKNVLSLLSAVCEAVYVGAAMSGIVQKRMRLQKFEMVHRS